MPQKPSSRDRSWGSRFDALPSSPPTSPLAELSPSQQVLDVPAPGHEAHKRRVDKMPHDASVFVGSLPTNLDPNQLSLLLSNHLAEYAQVKNVKVIRDSKGGVCAFVQCQDALAATQLLTDLKSTPSKPFLGRHLRFEPARAFRTLIISYRKPTAQTRPTMGPNGLVEQVDEVDLDLPDAMRISRFKNAKFHTLSYNAKAIQEENHAHSESRQFASQERSLFLHPLSFDEQTIRTISTYFGKLESFSAYIEKDSDGDASSSAFPVPHDAPRLPHMDQGCFEVKWAHRDDCVSALITLRRVPHITATWAHQPTHYIPNRDVPNGPSYPLHVQSRRSTTDASSIDLTDIHQLPSDSPRADWVPRLPGPQQSSHQPWTETDFPPLTGFTDARSMNTSAWVNRPRPALPPPAGDSTFPHHPDGSIDTDCSNVAPTPGLGMSPVTPKTPNSQFPATPTSTSGYPAHDEKNWERRSDVELIADGGKLLDPSTLFVGGLEMFGPKSWDEERIAGLFAKYEGLMSVRLVRPQNAKAAFAFVKFDNIFSPAKAILEEHNRIHDGRAIRVQLRDCNPHRLPWKRFGPVRLPQVTSSPHSHPDPQEDHRLLEYPLVNYTDNGQSPDYDDAQPSRDASRQCKEDQVDSEGPSEPCEPAPTVSLPSSSPSPVPDAPIEREENKTANEATQSHAQQDSPSPSSMGMRYPVQGSFYPFGPWMSPYHHFMPHSTYYNGFMSMPAPVPPSYTGAPPDANISHTPYWPMHNMAFLPYPAPATVVRPPGEQPTPIHPSQAPLQPTGFIQNDQGPLIPLYQPDALDQYMSTHPTASPPAAPSAQPEPTSPASALIHGHAPNNPTWGSAPPASACMFSSPHTRPMPQPLLSSAALQSNSAWAHAPYPYPPPLGVHVIPGPGSSQGQQGDNHRRHGGRKDYMSGTHVSQHHKHNSNAFRHRRTNMADSGQAVHRSPQSDWRSWSNM